MLPYVGVVYALTTGVLLQTTIVVLTRLLDTPHLCLSIDFIDIHDEWGGDAYINEENIGWNMRFVIYLLLISPDYVILK